jgi:hypothetical protein
MAVEIWSTERLSDEVAATGSTQRTISTLAHVLPDTLALWKNGYQKPTFQKARRLQRTISSLKRVRELYAEANVDMNNVRWLREQMRQVGDGSKPVFQEFGPEYLQKFCDSFHISVEEFLSACQLSPRLACAEIFSAPCQTWVRAWAGALFNAADKKAFPDYAKGFENIHAALTDVANKAFGALIAEVGRIQIMSHMKALWVTGELAAAPKDIDQN